LIENRAALNALPTMRRWLRNLEFNLEMRFVTDNPKPEIKHPRVLWLVRHAESIANLARRKAENEKLLTIEFPGREMDVPLSELGVKQSIALGNWFSEQKQQPTVLISSPYVRTKETARLILDTAKIENARIFYDERLREREFGIFDRLTWTGSMQKYPEECEKRIQIGKFYYRPPHGESWCDVAVRVRSVWRDIQEDFPNENVMIVSHEAVIHLFRYVLESLSEEEILKIDRAADIINCQTITYLFDDETQRLVLEADNFVART
jgi:broad specificity phosphatase PhoE